MRARSQERCTSERARPPLAAAIITFNEERNLERCLRSVQGLVREIVVIDSGSTDRTAEIARAHGARFEVHPWPGHVVQKNRALQACTQPWVLALDADEALSEELRQAVAALFARGQPPVAGYWVNRRNFYLGAWIRHAWYPEWRLRLVRRERARWEGADPHDVLRVEGPTARLQGDLLHWSYRDLSDHLARTLAYARIGARELIRAGRTPRWYKVVFAPWWRLVRSLVIRQAWRDGWRGWLIAFSSMLAAFAKYAFVIEHRLTGAGVVAGEPAGGEQGPGRSLGPAPPPPARGGPAPGAAGGTGPEQAP